MEASLSEELERLRVARLRHGHDSSGDSSSGVVANELALIAQLSQLEGALTLASASSHSSSLSTGPVVSQKLGGLWEENLNLNLNLDDENNNFTKTQKVRDSSSSSSDEDGDGEEEEEELNYTERVADAIASAAMRESISPPQAQSNKYNRRRASGYGRGAAADDLLGNAANDLGPSTRSVLQQVLEEKRKNQVTLAAMRTLDFDQANTSSEPTTTTAAAAHAAQQPSVRRHRHTPKTDATIELKLKSMSANEKRLEAELLGLDPTLADMCAWDSTEARGGGGGAAGDDRSAFPEEYRGDGYHHQQQNTPAYTRGGGETSPRRRREFRSSTGGGNDFKLYWSKGPATFEEMATEQPPAWRRQARTAASTAFRRNNNTQRPFSAVHSERFYLRQVEWKRRNADWREQRKHEREEEEAAQCTFTPNADAAPLLHEYGSTTSSDFQGGGSGGGGGGARRGQQPTQFELRLAIGSSNSGSPSPPNTEREREREREGQVVSKVRSYEAMARKTEHGDAYDRADGDAMHGWAEQPSRDGMEPVWTRLHDEAERKNLNLRILQEEHWANKEEEEYTHKPHINPAGPEVQPKYLDPHPAVSAKAIAAHAEANKECTFHPRTLAAKGRTPECIREESRQYQSQTILGTALRYPDDRHQAHTAAPEWGHAASPMPTTGAHQRMMTMMTPQPSPSPKPADGVIQHTPNLFEINEADIGAFDGGGGGEGFGFGASAAKSTKSLDGSSRRVVDPEEFWRRQMSFAENRDAKVRAKRDSAKAKSAQKPVPTQRSQQIFEQNNRGTFLERVNQSIIRKKEKKSAMEAEIMRNCTFTPATNRRRSSKANSGIDDDGMHLARDEFGLDHLALDQLSERFMRVNLAAQPSTTSVATTAQTISEQASYSQQPFKLNRFRESARSRLMTELSTAEYTEHIHRQQEEKRALREEEDRRREEKELEQCTFKPQTRDAPSYIKTIAKNYTEWKKEASAAEQQDQENVRRPFQYP